MTKKQEREQIRMEVARQYKERIRSLEMENQRLVKLYSDTYKDYLKEKRARAYYSSRYDHTPFLGLSLSEAFRSMQSLNFGDNGVKLKTNEDVMKSLHGIDLARYVSVLALLSEEELLKFFKAPNEFEEDSEPKEFNVSIKGKGLELSIPVDKRINLLQLKSSIRADVLTALIDGTDYVIDAPYPVYVYNEQLVDNLPHMQDGIIYVDAEYCNSPRPRDVIETSDLEAHNLYIVSVSDLKEEYYHDVCIPV